MEESDIRDRERGLMKGDSWKARRSGSAAERRRAKNRQFDGLPSSASSPGVPEKTVTRLSMRLENGARPQGQDGRFCSNPGIRQRPRGFSVRRMITERFSFGRTIGAQAERRLNPSAETPATRHSGRARHSQQCWLPAGGQRSGPRAARRQLLQRGKAGITLLDGSAATPRRKLFALVGGAREQEFHGTIIWGNTSRFFRDQCEHPLATMRGWREGRQSRSPQV